jgi:7-cyano-7-deazaguanine synthase in queuosine biosynthesis
MTKEDFNETWSCYKGVEGTRTKQCGKCPTCIDRIRALVNSKVFSSVKDITDNYDLTEERAKLFLEGKL